MSHFRRLRSLNWRHWIQTIPGVRGAKPTLLGTRITSTDSHRHLIPRRVPLELKVGDRQQRRECPSINPNGVIDLDQHGDCRPEILHDAHLEIGELQLLRLHQ